MQRFLGRLAVVTGAGSGIGAAVATKLVEEGCQVVGLDINLEALNDVRKKLTEKRGQFHPIQSDVTVEKEVLPAFKWAISNLGPIHILINSAGIVGASPLISGDTSIWRRVIDTNVLGLCICTREAVQSMIADKVDGHVVHLNSVAGHVVMKDHNVCSASKFAVTNLTEVLRHELREANTKIKVTSISPGLVDTPYAFNSHEKHHETIKSCPILKPVDVANSVIYVLSTPPHVQVHELIIKPVGEIY